MFKWLCFTLLCSVSFSAFSGNDSKDFLETIKDRICHGESACERYYASGMRVTALTARFYHHCLTTKEESDDCRDARDTYDYIFDEKAYQ
ncbi:TPA: hypothetical protein LT055_002858 [Salmonella enterica subsp. enterica serovar Wedding]|nr:hypothetical protein [Salmonella enterica]EHJ5406871.1 hypothetical protein [Salmonella enterica subsp. enterica serovar Wedding]HBM0101341.1 hypothetical protein [Salmonella enterica subsp. enterica serovar Wedding]